MSKLPDDFKISVETRGGAAVVHVAGEVDLATHDELIKRLREVAETGSVIVDLSDCMFIDSSGIRALLLGRREAERFLIAGAGEQVAKVLEMTGLTEAVPVHGTVEQAIESLD